MTFCIHGKAWDVPCEQCLRPVVQQESSEVKTDNVRIFPGITPYSLDPDIMLNKAVGQTKAVVIVGWDHDGELFFSSSEPGGPEVLWLLEKAKQALLEIGG